MNRSGDILLAIDQGTSSTRAIAFSLTGDVESVEQRSFEQIYPGPGWVEHDAEVIWGTVLSTSRQVLQRLAEAKRTVAAIGITNQRETTILWDRRSGAPIYNAIVWQDRRTADRCRQLARDHGEAEISRKTGLRLDPYFSATKISWILDNVAGARDAARAGHIAFGTVDSFLMWRLTGGRLHLTDATNASRTALYDIGTGLLMQCLADVLGLAVRRPANPESTAFGVACLAGLGCGLYGSVQEMAALGRSETRFEPALNAADRALQIAGWRNALRRVRSL